MQSSSSDSSNDILKSISSLLRELTVGSHESAASDVNVLLKTIAGNSVSTDPRKLDTPYPIFGYGILTNTPYPISWIRSIDQYIVLGFLDTEY
ncbi:hypothetical protein Tco_0943938 [Tanacetum coccineum]